MSTSYSVTESITFTTTHAKNLASKVATDLKRMQRFHGKPSDENISKYEQELISFLVAGYLEAVTYGFHRDGDWIVPTLRYSAKELNSEGAMNDDPGRIPTHADIAGAKFYSYLTYSSKWDAASPTERASFSSSLPFQRVSAVEPGVQGYFATDKSYSSGGRALDRASVRNY